MLGLRSLRIVGLAAILIVVGVSAQAGEADVVKVNVRPAADGSFAFDVSVSHADEGWEHYADAFDILTFDGQVLGTRVLLHPHVGERPFTRSLSSVEVPEGTEQVRFRAHDLVHGYGGAEMTVDLVQVGEE